MRLTGFVQFYPLVTLLLLVYLFPARYTHSGDAMVALGWYFLASPPEVAMRDHSIYPPGIVSAASA